MSDYGKTKHETPTLKSYWSCLRRHHSKKKY